MQVTIVNGQKYISTEYRGTEYTLMRNGQAWGVATRRLNYGTRLDHLGGFKGFRTLAEVQSKCKAFASLQLADVL